MKSCNGINGIASGLFMLGVVTMLFGFVYGSWNSHSSRLVSKFDRTIAARRGGKWHSSR